jgi:hypothetical protein
VKIYIVAKGNDDYLVNVGVHQVESYAIEQANDLMTFGEWSGSREFDTGYSSGIAWFRNDDFVFIETWELKY